MTLNCIWWWGFGPDDLMIVEHPFIAILLMKVNCEARRNCKAKWNYPLYGRGGWGCNLSNNRSFLEQLENITSRHPIFVTCPEKSCNIGNKVSDHVSEFFFSDITVIAINISSSCLCLFVCANSLRDTC